MEQVIKELPVKSVETREEVPTTPDRSIKESVNADLLAGVFGVKPGELSAKDKQQIDEIVTWVKTLNGNPEDLDLTWAVVKKRNQLGTPRIGNSTLEHMYAWYRASKEYADAEEKLKILELGNV